MNRTIASSQLPSAARLGTAGLVALALLVTAGAVRAQTPQQQAKERQAQARELLAKYTADPGRHDTDGLLKEPAVKAALQRVVGNQVPKLMQNLGVRGDVAYDGGTLVIAGNANHKGGEEEAVVCVIPFSPSLVEAGIFSRGKVTVYATAEQYEHLSICVKDWITQVNSGHRDRFKQPQNVQVVRAR